MIITLTELIGGFYSIFFVIISLGVGFSLIFKYTKNKQKNYIYAGITWVGLCTPWLPSSIAIIKAIITGTGIPINIYFLLGNVAVPIISIFWTLAYVALLEVNHKKILITIVSIYGIIFEVFLITFLTINPNIIGELVGLTNSEYKSVVLVYLLTTLFYLVGTGAIFARKTSRMDDKETRLKGRLLLLAYVAFLISALFDAGIPMTPITLIIIRTILVLSAILFYFSFNLPKTIKKIFIKNK